MAAPPKDTIYAYWRATLLVTKGHTVKILNLWRTCTLSTPKYAEKAQKRCCVLCVWLYLLPSSFEQWPKGHYFIGLRCWLPHNVQKSPLFQTNIKAGLRMQHYPHDTHIHKHTHTHSFIICVCMCVCLFLCFLGGDVRKQQGLHWICGVFILSKVVTGLTEKVLCPPSVFEKHYTVKEQWKSAFSLINCLFEYREAYSAVTCWMY